MTSDTIAAWELLERWAAEAPDGRSRSIGASVFSPDHATWYAHEHTDGSLHWMGSGGRCLTTSRSHLECAAAAIAECDRRTLEAASSVECAATSHERDSRDTTP